MTIIGLTVCEEINKFIKYADFQIHLSSLKQFSPETCVLCGIKYKPLKSILYSCHNA